MYLAKFSKLWQQFMSFESTVGDLSSVLKVEKRRGTILKLQVEKVT